MILCLFADDDGPPVPADSKNCERHISERREDQLAQIDTAYTLDPRRRLFLLQVFQLSNSESDKSELEGQFWKQKVSACREEIVLLRDPSVERLCTGKYW